MKKIIIFLISAIFITGCSNKALNYDAIFNNLKDEYKDFVKVDKDTLEVVYGIDTSLFDSYIVVISEDVVTSKMYAIFEVKNDDGKYEAEYFMDSYKESWLNGYFPEEEKLVKNYKKEEYGNYIIYVVNEDTENIIKTIKK